MKFLLSLLPLGVPAAAGALVTLQAGYNAQLGRALGHPLWATLVSFLIGLAGIVAVMMAMRVPAPALAPAAALPWWIWLGGLFGAIYVTAAIIFAPQLGAAVFMGAVVAGQMLASLLLDHYGLGGFPEKPATLARLAGAVLLIAGVFLLQAPAAPKTPVSILPASMP